jgi:hypothetical protein
MSKVGRNLIKENMKIQLTMPNFIWTSDRVTRVMNFIKIGYETHAHVSKKNGTTINRWCTTT